MATPSFEEAKNLSQLDSRCQKGSGCFVMPCCKRRGRGGKRERGGWEGQGRI